MAKRRIGLILPIRFACRAFLATRVYALLKSEAELLLISPYAESERFKAAYGGKGVTHAMLLDFSPVASHERWQRYLRRAIEFSSNHPSLRSVTLNQQYHKKMRQNRPGPLVKLKTKLASDIVPRLLAHKPGLALLRKLERRAFFRAYSSQIQRYFDLLERAELDLLVSTCPNRPQEGLIARAAERLRLPHIAYILSFDNISCYSDYPRLYDQYLVWNTTNAQELLQRYRALKRERISVCGPLQFDFYFQKEKYLISRVSWCRQLGVPDDTRLILFSESGEQTGPHEPALVSDLAQLLARGQLGTKLALIVRFHPMHPEHRWKAIRESCPSVIFQSPALKRDTETQFTHLDGVTWEEQDLRLLTNTLCHSDVHLNVASTMTLDAAYFDRPAIGIDYDPRPGSPYAEVSRTLYQRAHLEQIVASGAMPIARSREELREFIMEAVTNPGRRAKQRQKMLESYDGFRDGKTAERVAASILGFRRGVL